MQYYLCLKVVFIKIEPSSCFWILEPIYSKMCRPYVSYCIFLSNYSLPSQITTIRPNSLCNNMWRMKMVRHVLSFSAFLLDVSTTFISHNNVWLSCYLPQSSSHEIEARGVWHLFLDMVNGSSSDRNASSFVRSCISLLRLESNLFSALRDSSTLSSNCSRALSSEKSLQKY